MKPIPVTASIVMSSGRSMMSPPLLFADRNDPRCREPKARLPSDLLVRLENRIAHGPRHRRGRRNGAAVLDDDGKRNGRRLGRRISEKPTMIAQSLVDLLLFVTLT